MDSIELCVTLIPAIVPELISSEGIEANSISTGVAKSPPLRILSAEAVFVCKYPIATIRAGVLVVPAAVPIKVPGAHSTTPDTVDPLLS